MPIPTDTYWNIKRLNWVFAVSAVVLMAVTGWSIIQDYNKNWRRPQRNARVWEAALTEERIDRETTPQKQERLERLEQQIAEQDKALPASAEEITRINQQIAKITSDRSNLEFRYNNAKALVTVDESQLQDAITANDTTRADALRKKIAGPREQVEEQAERLAEMGEQLKELRDQLAAKTKAKTELERERTKLTADTDLLKKKLIALDPSRQQGLSGWLGSLSSKARATPLLQFVNPSERVQQVVLSDVQTDLGGVKRVEAIDRCMTCHVNIANKEFSEGNLLAFLEEQVASARRLNLPELAGGRAADPAATVTRPGPVAMPEFWHAWAVELAPAVLTRNAARINAVAGLVGKQAIVTVDGSKVDKFTYDPKLTGEERHRQDTIFREVLRALLTYPQSDQPFVFESGKGSSPRVVVEVPVPSVVEEKALATARLTAMRLVEELTTALRNTLDPRQFNLLEDRYRTAMVAEVNVDRRRKGYDALDASPVYLAHPNLALYVDPDSPHSFERVGCTSCHDGSGVETDFVLAAHTPRPIWVDQVTGTPVLPTQIKPKRPLVTHLGPDLSSMLVAVYPPDSLVPQLSSLHLNLAAHYSPTTQPVEHAGAGGSAKPQAADAAAHVSFDVPAEAPVDAPPTPYVDPVTGKEGRAVSQLTHWKKYEPESGTSFKDVNHYWDRPMLPPQYLQANCVRCHTDVYDIKDQAPVIHEGRMLFKNMGCVNCHQMDSITPEVPPSNPSDARLILANGQRKVGTDLRHITAKLSPAMINSWIWSPKAFRPSTKMPHFFMLENNSSDEELRRTRQEARAITEYLVRTANPLPPRHVPPAALKGNADAGRAVFNNIGCLGCHSNLNDPTGTKRGDKVVTLGEQWIVDDLVKGGRLADELATKLGKAPDTKTLRAEAIKMYDGMTYNERQLYALEHLGEKGEQTAAPRYPDNTPKPVFMHHGPELSGIGTKLTAGGRSTEEARLWLYDWLKEPRHYSEYTLMPRLRLSDQQTVDLVEYLLSMKRTNDAPNDTWTAGFTSPDSAKLQEMAAMFLRSRFSNKKAMEKADEDDELSTLAADALKPPDADAAAFKSLRDQAATWSKDERRMVFLGKKLIGHYGCMSCHAINGAETLTSPCANLSDWGQKALSQIAFDFLDHHKVESMPNAQRVSIPMVNGLSADVAKLTAEPAIAPGTAKPVEVAWPHVEHSRTSWLTQKLKNTRVYDRGKVLLEPREDDAGRPYDKLKMPTFYFSDREVDAIVTFVISNRDRLITPRLTNETRTEQAQRIAQGRQVAEKYNCINCHQIEQNVPVVQQYYKADELTSEAPPSLRGEGNKVQHAWLFSFLKDVENLRPLLHSDTEGGGGNRKIDIRMPSFPLEDGEVAALAAYFAAVSNQESANLAQTLDPVVKYIHEQMDASDEPLYAESPWPGDDWHRRPEFANAARALVDWATTRDQVTPVQLDPTRNNAYELGRTFRGLLFKARFIENLYDAPYPFTESPRPQISDARFKLGESLFYEMQCLKCHVLGDPTVEGSQKNPTAPNLNLTYRRLQPRWVRRWVQEPGVIQAKTLMPPFLSGAAIYHLDGLPFPRGQGGDVDAERFESTYGATADAQGQLLLDFLYAAGVRNYTGIQPAQAGPLPGITPISGASSPQASPQPATQPATPPSTAAAPTPIAGASQQAATQAATQTSTAPAPVPQPLAMHPEFRKPILPGKAPEIAKPTDTAVAEKPAAPVVAGVRLTGKVMFKGTPPEGQPVPMGADASCASQHDGPVPDPAITVSEKGELQDVVISVEGVAGGPTRSEPAVLDQKGCMYVPHVLAMQVGQPILVKNSDPFLHNVNMQASINPALNFGQNKDPAGRRVEPMKAAERFRVKCDVHPWMSANFHVFEHPYFATSAADGSFTIENVPPGTYKLTAVHERFGTQTKDVTVEAGKPLTAEFTFSEASARVSPSPVMKLVTMAMLGAGSSPVETGKAAACPTCAPLAASRTNSTPADRLTGAAASATPQAEK